MVNYRLVIVDSLSKEEIDSQAVYKSESLPRIGERIEILPWEGSRECGPDTLKILDFTTRNKGVYDVEGIKHNVGFKPTDNPPGRIQERFFPKVYVSKRDLEERAAE